MTSPNPSFTPIKTIVLTGMMGAGKTCIGCKLAERLGLPFMDADSHIAEAAGRSVSEIFERHGEEVFRDSERRVIARLLGEPVHVLAIGGGAFTDLETRALISQKALSVWLRADIELLLRRVLRRNTRPLLKIGNPREILEKLMEERYSAYAQANVIVDSADAAPEVTVGKTYEALAAYIKGNPHESRKAS
jgi:shikimate kinase